MPKLKKRQIRKALRISHEYYLEGNDDQARFYWDVAVNLGWTPTYPATDLHQTREDPPELTVPSQVASNTSRPRRASWSEE